MSEAESPPVPPEVVGGDERLGWQISGVLCLLVGWGIAIVANALLHLAARGGAIRVSFLWFGPSLGPYSWTVAIIGGFVGAFGVVLLHLARHSPRGPFVLPGYPY